MGRVFATFWRLGHSVLFLPRLESFGVEKRACLISGEIYIQHVHPLIRQYQTDHEPENSFRLLAGNNA